LFSALCVNIAINGDARVTARSEKKAVFGEITVETSLLRTSLIPLKETLLFYLLLL